MSNENSHRCEDLIKLFNQCFEISHRTCLARGTDEPLYCPATDTSSKHMLYFAHGFFSSALHECAHWFIAGPKRRLQVDFGYWYTSDGRSCEEQALFQQLEVKPQAIELILSDACGYPFQVSLDNLNGVPVDASVFKSAITQQAFLYQQNGLPKRAEQFRQALARFYGT